MKSICFETVSRYDRKAQPVSVMLPFCKGELFPDSICRNVLTDGENIYPFQPVITSCHDDGSIRYLVLRFLASFRANHKTEFRFTESPSVGVNRPEITYHAVAVEKTAESGIILDNGLISVELGASENGIIERIIREGRTVAVTEGPFISDGESEYAALVGDDGWQVEETGPLFVSLSTHGRHTDVSGRSWFDYIFRIRFWAGTEYIEAEYQIINTERSRQSHKSALTINNEQAGLKYDDAYPREVLHGLSFRIIPERDKDTVKKLYTSSFNFHATEADADGVVSASVSADTILETPNEMFPEVMFSTFGCTWKTGRQLIGTEIYQAYQNFPKALSADQKSISLSFYPDDYEPIEFPQGVQKTSRFFIFCMDGDASDHEVIDQLLTFEMPPVGCSPSSEFIAAGSFGKEVSELFDPVTERFLYRFVDSRAKGLGFLNFGDCPEWEYSKQGRSLGRDIWINNEYDMIHDFIAMFVRSGDRRYFDYAQAAVRHWMDVDYCHFSESPYHEGLLYTHSVNHVSGQMVPSHQWVQGFLDYYHLTGYREAYDTAMTIGEKLEELVKLPIYNKPGMVEPREIGWALRNFVDLYAETHDEKWKEDCLPIVKTYIEWARLYGTWTSPYPDNYMDRVPFMMQVGIGGLYSYYKLDQREDIRQTLLTVIDDIVENCYNTRLDMFLGKMHPSIRYQNLNGMVLETLEIGYELTGDIRYLEKGLGMFSWITRENNPPIYDFSKIKRDAHTVIYNCPVGPKRFAQTLIPLLRYYTAALENNLI